jgi:hypothetical protein
MDEALLPITTSALATLPLTEVRSHLLDLFAREPIKRGILSCHRGSAATITSMASW